MKGWLAALAACAVTVASAAEPIAVRKDDLGREVAQVGVGKRIAALSPFITEAVFAVGAGAELVAVSEFSDFPPYARTLPKVSGAAGIAWEKLASVRPDIVFAWKDSVRSADLERFAQLNLPVFVLAGRRLADVPATMRSIAWMMGRNPPESIAAFEQRIEDQRRASASKPRVTVFVEIQHRPLMTIAGNHFMNDALEVCGAQNVFAGLPGVAPQVSWEQVMAANPAVVVGAGAPLPEKEKEFRERWAEHPTLSAVKNGAFVYLNGDHFFRPTPRLAEGIEALCKQLDAYRK